ncbi:MAG: superoxide dismutase, Ni [Anaerolineales bacterium]
MFHSFVRILDNIFHFQKAKAHCDIPCGIYDPHQAQVAALTVVRMIDLMEGLAKRVEEGSPAYDNSMSRYIAVKEEHAELAKHEIRIIWGDFMKGKKLDENPNLHNLVHQIMLLGSSARQSADREVALQLVDAVNEFAEIFWDVKGVETKTAKAPYAPSLEMVYPVL